MAAWADPRVKLKAQAPCSGKEMRRHFLGNGVPTSDITQRSQVQMGACWEDLDRKGLDRSWIHRLPGENGR